MTVAPVTDGTIDFLGIEVPAISPGFVAMVGFHVLVGLACVVCGIVAMVSPKRTGRHPRFGTIYYWCLSAVAASAAVLSFVRWVEDYHLFILGALAFTAATLGRSAIRHGWVRLHIAGMGISYILLLTAFYVDNGKSLPLWRDLPPIAYWLLPGALGIPLIVRALVWHPLARRSKSSPSGLH